MMQRRELLAAAAGGLTVGVAGRVGIVGAGSGGSADTDGASGSNDSRATIREETLTLTTTTSAYDTGLLDELNAAFEARFGVAVHAVAQGTGAALETARAGDADVVMVHARSLEDEFMREGYGVNRRDVMFNDFVVVGPADDPAGIDGSDDPAEAFRAIAAAGGSDDAEDGEDVEDAEDEAETEATFVSRGDDSGTYAAELAIWEAAGIKPGGTWYREAGAGMGEVLTQADRTSAYTLVDRATYLARRSALDVSIRVEGPSEDGPPLLANLYGIVAVNPNVHEHVAYDLAMAYVGFLTSRDGRAIIEDHAVEGEQLFFPEPISDDPNFRQYVPEDWAREERHHP